MASPLRDGGPIDSLAEFPEHASILRARKRRKRNEEWQSAAANAIALSTLVPCIIWYWQHVHAFKNRKEEFFYSLVLGIMNGVLHTLRWSLLNPASSAQPQQEHDDRPSRFHSLLTNRTLQLWKPAFIACACFWNAELGACLLFIGIFCLNLDATGTFSSELLPSWSRQLLLLAPDIWALIVVLAHCISSGEEAQSLLEKGMLIMNTVALLPFFRAFNLWMDEDGLVNDMPGVLEVTYD